MVFTDPTAASGHGVPGQLRSGRESRRGLPLLVLALAAYCMRISLFVRGRVEGPYGQIDAYATAEIILTGFVFLALILQRRALRLLNRRLHGAAGLCIGYYALCAVSAAWSSMPAYSLFRAAQCMILFLAVFAIIIEASGTRASERFLLPAGTAVVMLDFLGLWWRRGLPLSLSALHTSSYSASAAMLVAYCVGEWPDAGDDRRRLLQRYGAVNLAAVLLGTSATCNVAVVAAVLLVGVTQIHKAPVRLLALLGLLAAATGVVLFGEGVWTVAFACLFPHKDAAQVASLHGRMGVWEKLWPLVRERPFIGHGFIVATRAGGIKLHTAHNAVLAVLLDTGLLGLTVAGVAVATLLRENLRAVRWRRMGAHGGICVFAAVALTNMSIPFVGVTFGRRTLVFALLLAHHAFHVCHSGRRRRTLRGPPRSSGRGDAPTEARP